MTEKSELIDRLRVLTRLSFHDSKVQVEQVFEAVHSLLMEGCDVRLPDIGTLRPDHYEGSRRRNNLSGKLIDVPSKIRLNFRSSKKFEVELTERLCS